MTTAPILPDVAIGRLGAMQECIGRYGRLVWTLARRFGADAGTAGDAEDAVQDIFIELWRCAKRFDPLRATEPTFVATVARRRLIDRRRRGRRAPATSTLEDAPELVAAPSRDRAAIAEEATRVRAVISALAPEQRRVLELCLVDGLTQSEVAARTGLPLGTVKSHARRGLASVRERLANTEVAR